MFYGWQQEKSRLIGDALINRTEDFLIEEDDILSDEDVKKRWKFKRWIF